VVDKSSEGMLADEVCDNVSGSFMGIGRPYRCKVVMLHHPGTFDVKHEFLLKAARIFHGT